MRESHFHGLVSVQPVGRNFSGKYVGKTHDQPSPSADTSIFTLLGVIGIVEEEAVKGWRPAKFSRQSQIQIIWERTQRRRSPLSRHASLRSSFVTSKRHPGKHSVSRSLLIIAYIFKHRKSGPPHRDEARDIRDHAIGSPAHSLPEW